MNYILDGKIPVQEPDLLKWAKWMETASRTVSKTTVGEAEVSTVFLALDHQFGDGSPILFETMVFGGERDSDQWRYSTWEQAEAGHQKVVAELESL